MGVRETQPFCLVVDNTNLGTLHLTGTLFQFYDISPTVMTVLMEAHSCKRPKHTSTGRALWRWSWLSPGRRNRLYPDEQREIIGDRRPRPRCH